MSSLDHGYWRSLKQLEQGDVEVGPGADGDPHEFPATAHVEGGLVDPMSRRNLFQLMGAGLALAGVAGAGCKRYDREEIVPLARRPEDQIPGVPQQYATAWDFVGVGQSLLATSYEGRPIKVDGNPEHPFASGGVVDGTQRHGGSSAFIQASILHLYDPDRSKSPMTGGKGATFDDFKNWLAGEMPNLKASGARVRVLSEASSSPTLQRLRNQVTQQMPGAQWYEWEPVSFDNERTGTWMAYGHPVRPLASLDKAQVIVTLDADLFVEHPARQKYARDWARSRRFGDSTLGAGQMNRMYAVESTYSTTGAVADHRLPLRSELILPFAMALDARIAGGAHADHEMWKDDKIAKFLDALVGDLNKFRGNVVVVAGRRQPALVHALVARINQNLGASDPAQPSHPLDYVTDPDPQRVAHGEAIVKLAKEIQSGQVDYLFILGGNPVFDAPADLGFGDLLAQVKKGTVHLSEYVDETSSKTMWHLPRAHYLEAWGDCRTWDGTVTLAQPLIEPMYGGLSSIELVSLLLGSDTEAKPGSGARGSVEKTFELLASKETFRKALHDGFVPDTALPVEGGLVVGQLQMAELKDTQKLLRVGANQVEVVFTYSTQTWDGRFGNNAWLWELPDFLTKTTWDNYALVGPSTSNDLGLANDTMIELTVAGKKVRVPCYTMPGQALGSIAVVLGGGRTQAGRVGGQNGRDVKGFDVYPIRPSTALDIAGGSSVAATGDSFAIASTVEHWDISAGGYSIKDLAQKGIAERIEALVREATLDEASKPGWTANEDSHFPEESLWKEHEYPEGRVHRWGMAIDLSTCTGCNACVVACQAENNIPVVGKDNVFMNREMHWLRIDRYFSGPPDDPEIVHQPLGCVQCENAPCEQVCPVGATIHSSEGLNDMVYNRCIGTRYCLNNCPYKVRRFNFFDYNQEWREARNKVRRLLFNPEVTVRMRGVMEKCTYCVQRIQNAKISAKNARTAIEDGDIVTACQAACPTEAIVFGDLNDPKSRVRRLHNEGDGGDRRSYGMLSDELNTKPRTHHLARIKNPNKDLER